MKKNGEKSSKILNGLASWFRGMQLLLVQSVVCILVILLASLLRVAGGDIFTDLSALFQKAMLEEVLFSTVSSASGTAYPTWSMLSESTIEVPVNTKIADDTTDTSDVITPPLTGGVITSAYGQREDPFDAQSVSNHKGVDIAASEGTALYALKSGTVIDVDYEENGYGHHLIVECDDGGSYVYAHCQKILVNVGQQVASGDLVAYVGSTGRSTGSHLHFEWRENGVVVDPMSVLPETTYA